MKKILFLRIGLLLRLIRESRGMQSIKTFISQSLPVIGEDIKEWHSSERELKIPYISLSAWSAYEIGNRVPGDQVTIELIRLVRECLLIEIHKGNVKPTSSEPFVHPGDLGFPSFLHSLVEKEKFLSTLDFPLRYTGTNLLFLYFSGKKEIVSKPPFPKEYYKKEALPVSRPQVASLLLSYWLSRDNDKFKSLFAHWLLLNNRFASTKFTNPDYDMGELELYLKNAKPPEFLSFTNRLRFCAEFKTHAQENQFMGFEHLGPAIDVIMAFSERMEILHCGSRLRFYTLSWDGSEHFFDVPALWVSKINKFWGPPEPFQIE